MDKFPLHVEETTGSERPDLSRYFIPSALEHFKFPRPRRPILILGNKIYRNPELKIATTPDIPFERYIFGDFDRATTKIEYFINNVPVRPTKGRPVQRKSGRFVYRFDVE